MWWLNENPNLQKKLFLKFVIFFKIGKKVSIGKGAKFQPLRTPKKIPEGWKKWEKKSKGYTKPHAQVWTMEKTSAKFQNVNALDLCDAQQGWQSTGQYAYWPDQWSLLVLTGHYWSIGGQLVDWKNLIHVKILCIIISPVLLNSIKTKSSLIL